ncbi:NAD-dependent epimerase [Caballeronia mineralivorans PML1(12)]|uniref:NAD-dependent epimerase n=1 Tax=Caballeronia mineralivorans PML1(12) TaxID=908627 RepID=A0A0J1FZ58_9BURK|nr:D-erythronate dehydrogenase [Caballeronia mineralivorans]KLU25238.1 NAD-dependent epimerase [Caballeronia mineralivorans PML1(12)]
MKILITGAAGFLGQRLALRLLERGELMDANGNRQPITELVLLDVAHSSHSGDSRVRVETGDIADRCLLERVITVETAAIFHLAAIVSGQAEADFDLGMRINLDASRLLLDVCRERDHKPRVLFTSSVAVYGGTLPPVVRDDTALHPQSSYGTQKAMAELLLCDYTRRGFVDGRVLRLPTITVRPGRPNAAASSFVSGIVREPLSGQRSVCPVDARTPLWLLSPERAIESLIAGCELDRELLGTWPVVNLPGLSVSVAEMVEELRRIAGNDVADRIDWQIDSRIEQIVGSWPGSWETSRGERLGLAPDQDFAAIIGAFINSRNSSDPVSGGY